MGPVNCFLNNFVLIILIIRNINIPTVIDFTVSLRHLEQSI